MEGERMASQRIRGKDCRITIRYPDGRTITIGGDRLVQPLILDDQEDEKHPRSPGPAEVQKPTI